MKNLIPAIVIFIFANSCINRLDIESDKVDAGILVVDGLITDQPGPYKVRLFRSSGVDDVLNVTNPFIARKVVLSDDAGNSEEMTSGGDGVYETSQDGIRGVIGRKYSLLIEGTDGTLYESTQEEMLPPGQIDNLYFQWEESKPLTGPTEYGFRVFLDSRADEKGDLLRWKFSGSHQVQTFPEFELTGGCKGNPDPPPCSGVVVSTTISQGFVGIFLETVGPCTCCDCWTNDTEKKPRLNDKLSTDGTFKKIEMGYIPFDQWTFRFGKYMVKVEQMSLTREAFEFWKIIRDQKEGASSLFQPSFGKVRTNFTSSNPNKQVTGIFYPSAIAQKVIFIKASDALIPVPDPDINPPENCFLFRACDQAFPGASRTPPPEWE